MTARPPLGRAALVSVAAWLVFLLVCGVVILRHWSNIKRLLSGKEAAVVGRAAQ